MAYQDIRDNAGRLLLRYDADRRILEVVRRGQRTTIDLRLYEGPRAPDIVAETLAALPSQHTPEPRTD